MQKQGFKRGISYNNLYIKIEGEDQLIIVVYMDDIIFGGSKNDMCNDFSKEMQNEFEMSVLDEISFLGGYILHNSVKGYLLHKPITLRRC